MVDLLAPAEPFDDLPGTQLIAVEASGLRQRIGIAPGKTSTAKVLADVVGRARVRNLTLEEPDVSELVRRLAYSSRSIRELPSVFGFTRARSRNSATPSSRERSSSA